MTAPRFTQEFFIKNRKELRDLVVKDSLVIISSNGLLQRNSDTNFRFRQDSSFWYLTGLNEPDTWLVMSGKNEYLIVPKRDTSRESFDGRINNANLSQISGLEEVLEQPIGMQRLSAELKNNSKVLSLLAPPSYVEAHGLFTNPARARLIEYIMSENPKITINDIKPELAKLRSIKQLIEIEAIQSAIDLTAEAINHVVNKKSDYKFEYQIQADITAIFEKNNSSHAYQPIVANGKNACTLHYIANNMKIDNKQLLLMDVGAEINNYAADITRTISFGKPSKRQELIYQAVQDVQKMSFDNLGPGVIMKDYEQRVEVFMGLRLQELGLIKKVDRESVRKFFPHSTSHFLGLDVHDVGSYEEPLQPGTVLTVEPGIYIPDEGIGVRIEDNVLITESGVDVLSKNLPSSLA